MIKIVTDSSADLPASIVQELGITVVPLYVLFGDEVYRERVDISDEEFYHKLVHGAVHPATSQPNPQDFIEVYEKLSREADGIVSIHISSKLSGTLNSVWQAKDILENKCPISVIDSQKITVALGLITIAAAEAANAGKDLHEVEAAAKEAMDNTEALALLDTLKYLLLGGRIGKAKALVGSVLSVKPLVTIKDGEVVPAAQVRSRTKGMERLFDFVKDATDIEDLAIAYSTTPDDAQALAQRIDSVFTKKKTKIVRLGTTLGVHLGPGSLVVSHRRKASDTKQAE